MSNLSELLPAGGGGKNVDFVASGALGDGITVALKADGTVEAISGVGGGAGTPVVFEAAISTYNSAAFDSNSNKVVIAYTDNGNSSYGTAIVGTVSGASISFGTAVVFRSANIKGISATFDSANNKVVIAYSNEWSDGASIVGTVSGTSISFGSEAIFESATYLLQTAATFDSTNNKVVIVYAHTGSSGYGTAAVGTVSGTAISFGTPVVFEAATIYSPAVTYDSSASKVVIAYSDAGNSTYGTAIVGTVSGTSISFGTAVVYEPTGSSGGKSAAFDSNSNKVVIAYSHSSNSTYGTAIVGTVSGTTISFGTAVVFEAAATSNVSAVYDSANSKVVIAYKDGGNSSYGTSVVGTVSGIAISFSAPTVFNAGTTTNNGPLGAVYDSVANKMAIVYRDASNYGNAVVVTVSTTNNADFIGITGAAISDTASGSVTIKGGISTNVTGLTANATYYVQGDGTLSTTTSSVLAGKALSSTSINLDYTT